MLEDNARKKRLFQASVRALVAAAALGLDAVYEFSSISTALSLPTYLPSLVSWCSLPALNPSAILVLPEWNESGVVLIHPCLIIVKFSANLGVFMV